MHDFFCDEPGCEFKSLSHESEEQRDARAAQHALEHETGEPMPELVDFLKGGAE